MSRKLRVALILNIPCQPHSFGNNVPLSMLYLGTQLRHEGHTVLVLDRRTFLQDKDFVGSIGEYGADLIGICLYADGYTSTYRLINQIRRFSPNVTIVLGGPEISADREGTMQVFRGKADFLLAGEADFTLSQLANCLAENDQVGVRAVKGLSYWDRNEMHHNPLPEPIRNVDDIRLPSRELIDSANWKKWYYRAGLGRPSDIILTSRGCPFTCRFCYRLTPGYRPRSPENVLMEMGEIYKRGTKGLIIVDDNFTVNRERCVSILEGILRSGWRFAMKCRGRVNSIDPGLLKLMKRAGMRSVTFGIESGSQKVLDAMNKKTTVEQNAEAIRKVHEAGLQCYADMFLGFPGETPETIRETADFLMKTKPTGIQFGHLFPLHQTEVYETAKKNGTLVGDWGLLEDYPWVKLDWFDDIGVLRDEVRAIARRFWLNPSVILRGLKANLFHFSTRDYWDISMTLWGTYLRRR